MQSFEIFIYWAKLFYFNIKQNKNFQKKTTIITNELYITIRRCALTMIQAAGVFNAENPMPSFCPLSNPDGSMPGPKHGPMRVSIAIPIPSYISCPVPGATWRSSIPSPIFNPSRIPSPIPVKSSPETPFEHFYGLR